MAPKSAKVTLSTQHQTAETVSALVGSILGQAGCRACGRLIRLDLEFQVDPSPEDQKVGATSVALEGF